MVDVCFPVHPAVAACLCYRRRKRKRQASSDLNGAFTAPVAARNPSRAFSAPSSDSGLGSQFDAGLGSDSEVKRVQGNPFANNQRDSLEAAYVIKVWSLQQPFSADNMPGP